MRWRVARGKRLVFPFINQLIIVFFSGVICSGRFSNIVRRFIGNSVEGLLHALGISIIRHRRLFSLMPHPRSSDSLRSWSARGSLKLPYCPGAVTLTVSSESRNPRCDRRGLRENMLGPPPPGSGGDLLRVDVLAESAPYGMTQTTSLGDTSVSDLTDEAWPHPVRIT